MSDTSEYELALLRRGPRNALVMIAGGAALLIGSVAIFFFAMEAGRGVIFYGAFLGSFGVIGKGVADLGRSRSALRLFELEQRGD